MRLVSTGNESTLWSLLTVWNIRIDLYPMFNAFGLQMLATLLTDVVWEKLIIFCGSPLAGKHIGWKRIPTNADHHDR